MARARRTTRLTRNRPSARSAAHGAGVCQPPRTGTTPAGQIANPRLIAGVIADHHTAGNPAPDRLSVGIGFTEAVTTCLLHCHPSMLKAAHGLAILGDHTGPEILAQLIDLQAVSATRALAALNNAGLLDQGRFRRPLAAQAALQILTTNELAALHARAAQLLHRSDASAIEVADHLVAASAVTGPWVLPTLHKAAEQALAGTGCTPCRSGPAAWPYATWPPP